MDIWNLPGPSSFVDNIESAVRDGSNVIVRFPTEVPEGFERDLRERLHSLFIWNHIDASNSSSNPHSFLHQYIFPDVSAFDVGSITELAANPSFQGRLIWIENINYEVWPEWSTFLRAYSDACRNVDLISRTVIIVLLSREAAASKITEEAALISYDFRGVVDILDLFILVLWELTSRIKHRGHRALLAHTVAQVAQWDSFLANQLILLPPEEALSPENILRQYASERGWTSETPRCWESGTQDGTPEKPIVHSALLEVCGSSRIVRQRIWAAQAAVLLPLVEEQRVSIIEKNRRYLNLPIQTADGRHIDDPLDLDVGQLAWHLDRKDKPQGLRKKVRNLRLVRNKLAHMEPLEPKEALQLVLLSDS